LDEPLSWDCGGDCDFQSNPAARQRAASTSCDGTDCEKLAGVSPPPVKISYSPSVISA